MKELLPLVQCTATKMLPGICPVCKNKGDFQKIEKALKWDLYGCKKCDVHFWWPLRHPGKAYYESDYDMVGAHGKSVLSWGNRMFFKMPVLKSGRLLDIGCSSGEFLNFIAKKEFRVWGIDISVKSIMAAKILYGLDNVYAGTIESFCKKNNLPKFDVITFFEVLEHIEDPVTFMKQAKSILKPGGFLALSVPDRECLKGWRNDFPPQHLWRWNEKSLRHLLNSENFEIVKVIREPISFRYFFYIFFKKETPCSFGFFSKVRNKLKNRFNKARSGKRVLENDVIILKNEPIILKIIKKGAAIKKFVFKIIFSPLVLIGRILWLKWEAIYIVAKLK